MSRGKTVRSLASDCLARLPVPQAITAYPQDWVNGPSHTFYVDQQCGWSGLAIERMLTSHGIRVWGKMIVRGDIMFTVRRAQARWAQYLLERAGIPLRPGTAYCASTLPGLRLWQEGEGAPGDLLGRAFDWLMDQLGL